MVSVQMKFGKSNVYCNACSRALWIIRADSSSEGGDSWSAAHDVQTLINMIVEEVTSILELLIRNRPFARKIGTVKQLAKSERTPLLSRGGVDARSGESREATLFRADGVVCSTTDYR
jgi:hypothetical protein